MKTWITLALLFVATPAWAADFIYPQGGPITTQWTSPRSYGMHRALDIAGPNNALNVAARAGRVKTAAHSGYNGGLGHYVVISHASGYETWYLHHWKVLVRAGQDVRAGQAIGHEGSTGYSTGAHVHFEVRRYGAKIYVPGSKGSSVRKGAPISTNYPGLGGVGQVSVSSSGGGGSSSSSGNGLLAVGSQGSSVRYLQQKLKARGFDPGPIDGIFGPKTRAAVVAFQRKKGLVVDGIVGPKTKAALGW